MSAPAQILFCAEHCIDSFPCLQFLTGKGALGQLRLETSLNPSILKALVGTIVVFNLVTALLPNATFSEENQKDVRKRPAGMALQSSSSQYTFGASQGLLSMLWQNLHNSALQCAHQRCVSLA